MDFSVILALILSIVGNIINAWGMIFMKIGHEIVNARKLKDALQRYMDLRAKEEAGEKQDITAAADGGTGTAELRSDFLREPKWWIGMAFYGVGSLMHVASLGFGPSALLNPMEGLTLVANTLSAPPCLGEEITWYDIWGTIVILAGTLLVVFFGPHNSEEYTADEILEKFAGIAFIIWSVCIWGATIACYCISKYIEHINARDGVKMDGSLNPRGSIFLALTYTSTKGVMGGYTMLFGAMFAKVCTGGGDFYAMWETYLFFVLFVVFNVLMEYWRQKALNLFSTMYCVPLFQVTLVIFAVFTGAIFFNEFSQLNALELSLFFLGILVICGGVVILSIMTESRAITPPFMKMKAAFIAVFAVFALKAAIDPKKTKSIAVGVKDGDEHQRENNPLLDKDKDELSPNPLHPANTATTDSVELKITDGSMGKVNSTPRSTPRSQPSGIFVGKRKADPAVERLFKHLTPVG